MSGYIPVAMDTGQMCRVLKISYSADGIRINEQSKLCLTLDPTSEYEQRKRSKIMMPLILVSGAELANYQLVSL